MAQQVAEIGATNHDETVPDYCIGCLECDWTSTDEDVIVVDDAGGQHHREYDHLTTGPLTRDEARDDDRIDLPGER